MLLYETILLIVIYIAICFDSPDRLLSAALSVYRPAHWQALPLIIFIHFYIVFSLSSCDSESYKSVDLQGVIRAQAKEANEVSPVFYSLEKN